MGVKDLWLVLHKAQKRVTLKELSGKKLAVDLSGWICQAFGTQANPLRILYFRVQHLYCLGTSLVFVRDGIAPEVKHNIMKRRGCDVQRTAFRAKVDQCCKLLEILGVPYLQSFGEAEALCALLNIHGIVDGVITNDGDAFLYGATTVYRNLSTSQEDSHVSCYTMTTIQEKLGLQRYDLVALALLLGCDYCPGGVPGVGKKIALQLIRGWKKHGSSYCILQRFRQWALDDFKAEEAIRNVESYVRSQAITKDVHFPSREIIHEFLVQKEVIPIDIGDILQWKMPAVDAAKDFLSNQLKWEASYTFSNIKKLLAQWLLRHPFSGVLKSARILKRGMHHEKAFYEVQWVVSSITTDRGLSTMPAAFTTNEDILQFDASFPETATAFQKEADTSGVRRLSQHTAQCGSIGGERCCRSDMKHTGKRRIMKCTGLSSDEEEEEYFHSLKKRSKGQQI